MNYLKSLSIACLLAFSATTLSAEPPITGLTFSPDGSTLVVCSQSGISLLDWPSLKLRRVVRSDSPNLHHAAFSLRGDLLAVAGGTPADEGTVELFSWPSCQSHKTLRHHSDSVMSVAWLSEKQLATASLDLEVVVCDVETGKAIHRLQGHSRGVRAVVSLPKEKQLVSAGVDNSLRLWDAVNGELVHGLGIHTGPVTDLSIRPGDHALPMIASTSQDRTVRFWQPTIGRMVRFVRLPSVPLDMAWLLDGSQIVVGSADGHLRIIDPETADIVAEHKASDDWINAIALTPDSKGIVLGDANGRLQRIGLDQVRVN